MLGLQPIHIGQIGRISPEAKACLCNKSHLLLLCDLLLIGLLVLVSFGVLQSFVKNDSERPRPTNHTLPLRLIQPDDIDENQFQPLTSIPLSRQHLQALINRIPHVTEVNCSVFQVPPDQWDAELEELAQVVPAAEHASQKMYENCDILTADWMDMPVSEFEMRHPVAFSIMVYTNIDRFVRLMRAIYRTSNVYCIHVDAKASKEFKTALSSIISCFENVFLSEISIKVFWGYASVLEQEIVCLKELWQQTLPWQWVINLTGEEFPLKTNLELVHILTVLRGFNDVWVDPCTSGGPSKDWWRCRESSREGFDERWARAGYPPHFVKPYKGQVHAVLSRAMVDFILHSSIAHDVFNWSVKTDFSDEVFFSTLNANPHLNVPGSNAEYPLKGKPSLARLKLWKINRDSWPYCSRYLRLLCLLSPREFILIVKSRQLFANKFKPEHRPLGYACTEEWYFTKVVRELQEGRVQLDLREYHKLYYRYLGL